MAMSDLSIETVGLIYVGDTEPGIRRLRKGKGFCYKLPDGTLLGDEAQRQRIASLGLPPAFNGYLAEIAGISVSAKTFRTWAGSLAAFGAARNAVQKGKRPAIREMCEAAAAVLHNTPAVCRSSYIHPAIIALADKDHDFTTKEITPLMEPIRGLRADENRLLDFLVNARDDAGHGASPLQKAS
jgi:DNA topoisomerase IB